MATTRENQNNQIDDMHNVWIDNLPNKKDQTIEETQAWVDNLKESTIDSSISTIWVKSNLAVQQRWIEYERDIHTLVWFLTVADKLLEEIEDTKSWLSKRWLSKAWKKTIKEAKTKLKQYEKQLKAKKKALLRQDRAEVYDNDIENLRNLREQVNKVRQDIWMWQWWEFASTASYLYNSPENIKKSNKRQTNNLEFHQRLQGELKDWAILHIFNWNIQKANDFYRKIAEWKYTHADYELFIRNSSVLTPSFQRCWISIPTEPIENKWTMWSIDIPTESIQLTWSRWKIERNPKTIRESVDYSNMDWGESFKQWWLAGVLDKLLTSCSNMTPWQKDARKTVGVLGCVAGWIFGLYKFYTNEKMWFWSKAWITAWTIFWSQALTWKWPISLFREWMTWWVSKRKIQNRFGDAIAELDNSRHEVADVTVPAAQSLIIFNKWTTAGNIDRMTQEFSRNNNQSRTTFYNQSCDKIQRKYWKAAMESFQTRFSPNFDEEKRESWLASFWVTLSTNKKENVHELANNAIMNQTILEKFLSDNELKITSNLDKKAELDNYIKSKNEKNETIMPEDLKAQINEWFITNNKLEETTETSQNTPQNKPITNPETQKEKEIEQAIQNGLEKIYSHFEPKIKKINKIPAMKDIQKNDITKRFPELTQIIKTEFITANNNNTTINIDEAKMANIFDNFLKKLCTPQSTVPNYVKHAISSKNRSSLKSQLKEYKNKRNQRKYNNMRENFMVIFNNIFSPIESTLRSQNVSLNIKCNWQSFNSIDDAINSMDLFKI